MPYKRHLPVDVSIMLKKRYYGHHTICETIREIFMMTDNEEIKLKCRLVMSMAKAMNEKLKEYKAIYEKT